MRAPSSSRRPQQAKRVRADVQRYGSELFEKDLVDLRSRSDIPPPHPKSLRELPRSDKHKADAYAFSTFWGDKSSIPLHFYTDRRVLKASLYPIADADPGSLEALRVSYSVPNYAHLPPPTVPATVTCQLPLRPPAPEPVMVSSSSDEVEAMSSLLIRPRLPIGEASKLNLQDAASESEGMETITPPCPEGNLSSFSPPSPLGDNQTLRPSASQTPGAASTDAGGQHTATVVLEPEDQGGIGFVTPNYFLGPPPSSRVSAPGSGRVSMSERTPPPPSPAAPNHANLISSFSTMGDERVVLQSYKELLSSYEEACRSSSRAGQLEGELRALKVERAREKGQAWASVHRAEAVKAALETMQAERDSTMKVRDAEVKERDTFGAGRDEMLQSHDHLLDQQTETQRQAQLMEATLEEKTIQAVRANEEEAEPEVPASLWDEVRDDVSSPNPSNL
ncbi:hypothetical protein LIER_33690 [Lithospermum erythrorhizon]|uniref:Uncharacterized protein n=1 Tax=Lithospermum erythrorhizon TaxID=34254 RepID=A0AAV3S1H1_LITER